VNTTLRGCGRQADTKDVIDFPGRDTRVLGDSVPRQHECGTPFPTSVIGEWGIRLCEKCLARFGLIW
jgi:hypothetical protein